MTSTLRPPAPHSRRRAEELEQTGFGNGVDYLEVDPVDHTQLTVGLINPMPAAGPWGLDTDPSLAVISGGEKVRGIKVGSVAVVDATTLHLTVDKPGDFSPYMLELAVADLDPVLRRVQFSFMAACPSDLDCVETCETVTVDDDGPPLDTLAKDYTSFRHMLLDLVALRHPSLTELHAADLAITLLELIAAYGDELSYQQDAAFAEAYLSTARRRISVRRHTRLVDYVVGEGRNASAAVQVEVNRAITIDAGTQLFTRLPVALSGEPAPPAAGFDKSLISSPTFLVEPLADAIVFETAHQLVTSELLNTLHVHHWGEDEFGIPAGGVSAWLWAENPADDGAPARTAVLPPLQVGDRILLEQVRDPRTGDTVDLDPAQRWVVRLTEVVAGDDPAYDAVYGTDADHQVVLTQRPDGSATALPLLGVRWERSESPTRALCIRALSPEGDHIEDVALGRGNIVLADHGRTVHDTNPLAWTPDLASAGAPGTAQLAPPLRLQVPAGPLTYQIGRFGDERFDLAGDASAAQPALGLTVRPQAGPDQAWTPVADLFDSGPDDQHVVVEVNDAGRALLRFGDGTLGRAPLDAALFFVAYRIGNGAVGNVGAESLVHIAVANTDVTAVRQVRNPLPARDGTDPETVEHARQLAPDAFRAWQERAVIADDVVWWAVRIPGVRAAVAALRWTGSWYTWIVAVLPTDPEDLVDTAGTHQDLAPALRAAVVAGLDHVRLAGFDVDVRAPEFVAVDLRLHICAAAGHSRSDVERAARDALLAAVLPSGSAGLLAGATLTFGRPLLLGEVYAMVAAVVGVESVKAIWLTQYNQPDNGELLAGRLDVAPWQLLRINDDPSLPGRGVLTLTVDGGTP